ncbi:MAG: hypothetical protein R3E31_17225 [Chloroflexota bacterium]
MWQGLDTPDEKRREEKGNGVNDDGRCHPEKTGDDAPKRGTQGQHGRPGNAGKGVGNEQFIVTFDEAGQNGGAGRFKNAEMTEWAMVRA